MATTPWLKTPDGFRLNPLFPRYPRSTPAPYAQLTHACLEMATHKRPDFAAVIARLEGMQDALLAGHASLAMPPPAAAGQPPEPAGSGAAGSGATVAEGSAPTEAS